MLVGWPASGASGFASGCLRGQPAADHLAFARSSAGHEGVWTVRGDGTGLHRVTAGVGDGRPTWSPDGSRIAYSHRDPAGDFEVYVANADGTDQHNLTNSHATDDLMPSWSPDDEWIAYHSVALPPVPGSDTARPGDWEIMAVNPAGTARRNLSRRPPDLGEVGDRAAADVKPAWSPDGQSIVFESYRGVVNSTALNSELWVMPVRPDATAADAKQLTNSPTMSEWFPSWSPDGGRVAFMRQDAAQTNLTPGMKQDWNPVWSPDGARIAFSSERSDGGVDVVAKGSGWNTHAAGSDQLAEDTWDLYVMNDDGSCPTRLTTLGDAHDPAFG
jgi:Tol biopolymer transport system component